MHSGHLLFLKFLKSGALNSLSICDYGRGSLILVPAHCVLFLGLLHKVPVCHRIQGILRLHMLPGKGKVKEKYDEDDNDDDVDDDDEEEDDDNENYGNNDGDDDDDEDYDD